MQREDWIRLLEHHGGASATLLPPDRTLFSGDREEQRLWRAVAGEPIDVDSILGSRSGAILATDAYLAIEVWAECELAALHALHRLARVGTSGDAAIGDVGRGVRRRERLREAIHWHLEHTQPDNSTNRPWALHAFLLSEEGRGDAALYAETLLQNALVTEARDEPLSRWILADAARELRLAAARAPGVA